MRLFDLRRIYSVYSLYSTFDEKRNFCDIYLSLVGRVEERNIGIIIVANKTNSVSTIASVYPRF